MEELIKEFIPYEQALALKELNFNEPCFGYFNVTKHLGIGSFILKECNKDIIDSYGNHVLLRPTYSQTFKWFRKKYGLEPNIIFHESYFEQGDKNVYEVNIESNIDANFCLQITPLEGFKIPEEAELACLKKLIEIVKTK